MEPPGIADNINEVSDVLAGMVKVFVDAAVHFLGFQGIRFAALRVMKLSALALS